MFEVEFWVSVAFFIFVGILIYLSAHKMILAALDKRREDIERELAQARRLREEAHKLLADYQQKQHEAEQEAQAIIANAQAEAERIAAEARIRMEELLERRTSIAHARIAQAELQALADVRAAAADAAIEAASKILAQTTKGELGDQLIAQGIKDIKAKLN